MKKLLAIIALVAFLGGFTAPLLANSAASVVSIELADKDPKKAKTDKKSEESSDKKSGDCTTEKKSSDCTTEKKSSDCATEKKSSDCDKK